MNQQFYTEFGILAHEEQLVNLTKISIVVFFFSLLVNELDILFLKFMSNYFYARNYEF